MKHSIRRRRNTRNPGTGGKVKKGAPCSCSYCRSKNRKRKNKNRVQIVVQIDGRSRQKAPTPAIRDINIFFERNQRQSGPTYYSSRKDASNLYHEGKPLVIQSQSNLRYKPQVLLKSSSKIKGPLHLSPLIQHGETTTARYLSSVDPTLFANLRSHSAFITVNQTRNWHYYFWFFPIRNKPLEDTPWVIWLQGGPGVSSLLGLFTEIGPLRAENGRVTRMPVTWHSEYSLLFIDNPIQTGFSYSDKIEYISHEGQVAVCLVSFIQQFVQVFPELQKAPLFIAGQSFAGKYIPAFATYLHHNQNSECPINLKGLIMGNGYIDPPNMLHLSELGMQLGFIDPDEAEGIEFLENAARSAWNKNKGRTFWERACYANMTAYSYFPNYYNYLQDSTSGYGSHDYESFLSRRDIRRALHVGNIEFKGYNYLTVSEHFDNTIFITAKEWIEDLLEHYGVLCYNGQLDIIVAYALSVHTYRSLEWSGAQAFLNAPRLPIRSDHPEATLDPIGYVKAAGNFMEVMIRAAGHKAPEDQPLATKQIVDMFINKFK